VTSRQSDVIALVLIVASYLFVLGFWMFLFLAGVLAFRASQAAEPASRTEPGTKSRQLSPSQLISLARLILPASRVSGGPIFWH